MSLLQNFCWNYYFKNWREAKIKNCYECLPFRKVFVAQQSGKKNVSQLNLKSLLKSSTADQEELAKMVPNPTFT